MENDVFRKVGDISNAQSVREVWKSEISRCRALVNDIIENDKRDLMVWLLDKQAHDHNDIQAMRSIRKSCSFIG